MSEPTNVLLTGAHARVGPAILKYLGDDDRYEWTLLDIETHPDRETVVADVRDYESIRPAFEDQDAVIHLARSGQPLGDGVGWSPGLAAELESITNAYAAAVDAGVDSFVYASSHQVVSRNAGEWAVKRFHPVEYDPGVEVLDETVPVRPVDEYGLSKAYGEDYGRYCYESHGLRVYVLRIGWVLAGADERAVDHPYATAERGVREGRWERDSHEYAVNTADPRWCSHRDMAQLVDRCLQDRTVGYDVFYGVSDNEGRWHDLSHAREVVGYDPVDDVAECDGPPA